MDTKEQTELIITFHNTYDAIMGERALLDSGIDVRVMPMPPELGPGCGIALRISQADMEKAQPLLAETIDGTYCRAADAEGTFTPWNP
jgi:hypothetical protein